MTDQSLVQFSTPIRGTDEYQVVVRPTTLAEVDLAKAILAKSLLELAGPVKALAQGLKEAPPTAVELLQKELGAVVLGEQEAPSPALSGPAPAWLPQQAQQAAAQAGVPQGPQAPANAFNPQGHYQGPDIPAVPQSAFQPQHQVQQAPAPQWAGQPQAQGYVQQPQAPMAPQGECWACGKNPVCKDCNGPTTLISKEIRGKALNLHECASGQRHKGMWCKTPIWRSAQQGYVQTTGQQPPAGLVYEQ